MSGLVTTCAIIQLALSGPNAQHPGEATWNLDGSWTVDWPMVQEYAKRPAWAYIWATQRAAVADAQDSAKLFAGNGNSDLRGPDDFVAFPGPFPDFGVSIARALLNMKAAGKLWEAPRPTGGCLSE